MHEMYKTLLLIFLSSCLGHNSSEHDNSKTIQFLEENQKNVEVVDTCDSLNSRFLDYVLSIGIKDCKTYSIRDTSNIYLKTKVKEKLDTNVKPISKTRFKEVYECLDSPSEMYPLALIYTDSGPVIFIETFERKFPLMFQNVWVIHISQFNGQITSKVNVYSDQNIDIPDCESHHFVWEGNEGTIYRRRCDALYDIYSFSKVRIENNMLNSIILTN